MQEFNRNEVEQFINFLFDEEDIFEVRIKYDDDGRVTPHWIPPARREQFYSSHLAIHAMRKGHVWVGVGPREKMMSTDPKMNRVLWCDFSSDVTEREVLDQALGRSGLPEPSMIVWSGNGYHAYWKLNEPLSPSEARKYSKGVHGVLPSDNTYDPTRVMRAPGTVNWKDPDNPKMAYIVESNDNSYDIELFPKSEERSSGPPVERAAKTVDKDTMDIFLSHYLDGQKHNMALAVAGFLRKERFFNRRETENALKELHTLAGYEWPDPGLQKIVHDTYSRPLPQVAGRSALFELGVSAPASQIVDVKFPEPHRPTIQLVDFSSEIKEQEFWVDGIVGPGLMTLWAAAPKSGKSFCVMQLGQAIATGTDIWGMAVPKAKRVLYFQGELSKNMVYSRAVGMFGLENIPKPEQYAMTDRPRETITLNETPEVLLEIAQDYDVIIVDPLSAFNGNDENSYTSVRETLALFDGLQAAGKAVVLVHHTRKLDGTNAIPSASDARGSGLWVSAADAVVMQQKLQDGSVKLYFTLRAAPDKDPLELYRLPNGSFTSERKKLIEFNPELKKKLDFIERTIKNVSND